jgi:hypothetical protein
LPRRPKTPTELRTFGLVMAGALGVFGAIALWRGRAVGPWLVGAAVLLLACGLLLPRALQPIERVWMKVGEVLGMVMTTVILTLTFCLVMTPLGVSMRLFGKDTLGRRFDRRRSSYWVAVEPGGPGSRPDKPF